MSSLEYSSETANTPATTIVRCDRNRLIEPRVPSATAAISSGHSRKNWPWIDSDQKCCTTLTMLLRAA